MMAGDADDLDFLRRRHPHVCEGPSAAWQVTDGHLPPAAARLVAQWCQLHREDLLENWRRAGRDEAPLRIEGLDARKS
ncbi:DUF4160 domain-containing protein [Devosia enhydra]|uniref:DUF4160 domain-containing protein n=1 Tax=Devosia enhydra TaxID=665118 RepID=UPI001AECDA73|nr:DUF4160 domain-containing protein [Devosia enhydra]